MAIRNFIRLDYSGSGDDSEYRFGVRTASVMRGIAPPTVPRFAIGETQFAHGTPPVETQGQRLWGGFDLKYALKEQSQDYRSGFNIDPQYKDRLRLAQSYSGTVFNTSQSNVRLVRAPFKDVFVAYSTASNHVWTKSGSGAWAAASLPGAWTGSTPTAWRSDVIAKIGSTPYLLLGSDLGHVLRFDGTTWTEVGRPFGAAITSMAVFNSTLHLGGRDANGARLSTYDGTTTVDKFLYQDMNGMARIYAMLSVYRDSDNTASQLHVVAIREDNGYEGTHFMYDGVNLRTLKRWADNAPLYMVEHEVAGSRAIYFGMAKYGSVWRYTGDYQEVLHLDNPDRAYSSTIQQLATFGKFLLAPYKDATNGLSLLVYDGDAWWQGPSVGSSRTGNASGVGVYKETAFIVHEETTASRIFELQTGANFQTAGKLVTSLLDGGYREIEKQWTRVVLTHAPLAASESIQVEYSLDDATATRYFEQPLGATAFKDAANTTGIWDTTNKRLTVSGVGELTFASKIAGSTVVSAHVAYSGADYEPEDLSPVSLAAKPRMSEMSQGQYDGIESDDASTGDTVLVAGTLDQSQTDDDASVTFGTNTWYGQSFEPGSTDTLGTVSFRGRYASGFSGTTVRCYLYATDSGLPTGSYLARSDLTDELSGSTGEFHFNFPTEPELESGNRYALVLVVESGQLTLLYETASAYANGVRLRSMNGGSSWATPGGDLYFKTYRGAIKGAATQLYCFDLGGQTPVTLKPRIIGYGSDTTGAANGGLELSIWNANAGAWESVGTNSAVAASNDAAKTISGTISSNLGHYQTSGKVYLLARSTYEGNNSLAAQCKVDFVRLDGGVSTSLQTIRSLDVDTVVTGNITTATLTITHNSEGTRAYYLSVDGGTTWEVVTSGSLHTFVGTGNALRWRVDLTAASATATAPRVTGLTLSYAAAAYTSLGTNSSVGSSETAYVIGANVKSKLIDFRLTLNGPGTTTPSLYSYKVEYIVSPDVKEAFWCDLELYEKFEYSDGALEARTAEEQYDALLGLLRAKERFRLDWVDGKVITQATFLVGAWRYQQKAVGVGDDDQEVEMRWVPLALAEVSNA